MLNKVNLANVTFSLVSRAELVEDVVANAKRRLSSYYCFVNAHVLVESLTDARLKRALEGARMNVADGVSIVAGLKLLGNKKVLQVRGPTCFRDVLRAAESSNICVGFFGSTETVLAAIKKKLDVEYPKLKCSLAISPPFRSLTLDEEVVLLSEIRSSGAELILVGLGCPKQELWMAKMAQRLNVPCLGVGAAFDFYAGTKKECPVVLQRIGLEWLYRLTTEPRRLWRRYFVTNTIYIAVIVRELYGRASK